MEKHKRHPPNNIIEELAQALEEIIQKVFSSIFNWIGSYIKQKLNKSSTPVKIQKDFLDRKVKWKDLSAFGYSLKDKKDVSLSKVDLNRHTLVCGTTGAGKNVVLENIMDNQIEENIPIIFIDPKGDLKALQRFQHENQKVGRKTYIFSEAYKCNTSLNPLLEGSPSAITDRLYSIFEWSEPYYAGVSYNAIQDAVIKLKSKNIKIDIHQIYNYIFENLNSKDTQGVLSKLKKIVLSDFGNLLKQGNQTKTLSEIRKEKASLYIGLSTLGYPEISSYIGKLFFYELMHHSYQCFTSNYFNLINGNDLAPYLVVIDELGSVITHDFIGLLNKCRGANISLCVSFQVLKDLDKISPTFKDQLVGNINNFFIGQSNLADEAEYWANIIGTKTEEKKTFVIEGGREIGIGTKRDVEEFMVHPNIIKNLGIGRFVIKSNFPNNYLDIVNVHLKTKNFKLPTSEMFSPIKINNATRKEWIKKC